MMTRFIVLLSVLLLPYYGMTQTSSFSTDEKTQFTYAPDTGRIRNMVNTAASLIDDMPDSALALLTRALRESRSAGHNYGTGISWLGLGHVYLRKAMYRESIHAYRQVLQLSYREPRLETRRAGIYNNMAVQHMYLGELYKSMICLAQAALSIERGHSQISMSNIYNNIPIILRHVSPSDTQEHEQTLHYLNLAETIARAEMNYAGLGSNLISKGIYYGKQKEWDESEQAFREALHIARQYRLVNTEASALNNLATLYLQRYSDSARQALVFLHEALSLGNKVYRHHRIKTLHILGQTYYVIGDYKTSEPYLLQALKEAEAGSYSTEIPNISKTLSELYTKTKKYHAALEYYQRHVAAQESIAGKEIANNIHLLETRYRTAEKDKQILQKEYKISLQAHKIKEKNTWIISITAGALLLAGLLAVAYRSNKQQRRLQAHKIRNLQQEQEIIRLKAIMDGEEKERTRIARELHDGIVGQLSATRLSFGAIQNAHGLKQMSDFSDALKQLDEATQDLRQTAHNLMPEILLQAGLVEAIDIYCHKMSKGAPPVVRFHASGILPSLDQDFQLTLYRITQELVQNAVKHAQANQVLVQLDYQDQLLGLTVEDDGRGFDQAEINEHNGMGLSNLQNRIKALNGSISITSDPGTGTTIYIEFLRNFD